MFKKRISVNFNKYVITHPYQTTVPFASNVYGSRINSVNTPVTLSVPSVSSRGLLSRVAWSEEVGAMC